jgi:ferredoxin
MKIEIDRELCIGCGTCVSIAPETFELDSEGKSTVKNLKGNDEAIILDAAKSCPVSAIIIKDDNGKQIWPEKK